MSTVRIGVLLSGSGTNFQAILDSLKLAGNDNSIVVVISNKADAYGLERARKANIPAIHLSHRGYGNRSAYDRDIVQALKEHNVEWVVLAGFMRIVTPTLLNAFEHRVINIHPALLPSFKGLRGQKQAHDAKVTITGATVHLVTPEMDAGPIIAQGAVPAFDTDTPNELSERILKMEHLLYPMVVRWICEDRLSTTGGNISVTLVDGEARALFWSND